MLRAHLALWAADATRCPEAFAFVSNAQMGKPASLRKPLSTTAFNQAIRSALPLCLKELDKAKYTSHALKRGLGAALTMEDKPPLLISACLNHRGSQALRNYSVLAPGQRAAVLASVGAKARGAR